MAEVESLEELVDLWTSMREENYSEKSLVTDDEWKQWVDFEEKLNARLERLIVSDWSKEASLREIEEINKILSGAKRVSRKDLEARAKSKSVKSGLLKKLRKKF